MRSDAETVAVNVWWPGVRPQLGALPAPRAAFALRTLAHRVVELRLAAIVADAAAYVVEDESTRAEAGDTGEAPGGVARAGVSRLHGGLPFAFSATPSLV